MTPNQVKSRRLELGLTVLELGYALNMDPQELARIESGESDGCRCREFEEAFDEFEEKIFGTFAGA
jgi:transcriptional regulator with XRE-family HTH domain